MGQTGLLWDALSVLGTWDGKDSVIWALNGTDRATLGCPDCPWDVGWKRSPKTSSGKPRHVWRLLEETSEFITKR